MRTDLEVRSSGWGPRRGVAVWLRPEASRSAIIDYIGSGLRIVGGLWPRDCVAVIIRRVV